MSLQEGFASVVARVESLPLAAQRLEDFVRGRMSEAGSPFKARRSRGCLRVCWRRVLEDDI